MPIIGRPSFFCGRHAEPITPIVQSPTTYDFGQTANNTICMLDNKYAIAAYSDYDSVSPARQAAIILLTFDGNVITPGTIMDLGSSSDNTVSICALDANNAIACWGNSFFIYACCITFDGTSLSAGPTITVHSTGSAVATMVSVCAMDSTHAIACYRGVGPGVAVCLTRSGNTLFAGATTTFETGATSSISTCAMDSTHAIVCYSDGGNSNYGTACCLELVGTAITAYTPVVFQSVSTALTSTCFMDTGVAVVAATENSLGRGVACCLTLSGSVITPATISVFETDNTGMKSVCRVTPTRMLVVYKNVTVSNDGMTRLLILTGTSVNAQPRAIVDTASTMNFIGVVSMNRDRAITVYQGPSATSQGRMAVIYT
jgi:hypothetical protein